MMDKAQIHDLAIQAGFKGHDADVATAIALAESGGNPNAHNSKPPDDSYGLWQINMRGSLGPDRRKRFALNSNDELFVPATNARVAYGIYNTSGFTPWTTYTSGKYKEFMADTGGTGGSATIGASLNPASAFVSFSHTMTNALNALGDTLFKIGANIAGVTVAIVLIILGFAIVLRKPLMNVVPGGKVANAVKAVSE